jgi:hypothetical protein
MAQEHVGETAAALSEINPSHRRAIFSASTFGCRKSQPDNPSRSEIRRGDNRNKILQIRARHRPAGMPSYTLHFPAVFWS